MFGRFAGGGDKLNVNVTPEASLVARPILASILLASILSVVALSCSSPTPTVRSAKIFSSVVSLSLYDHATDAAFEACFARLREIDLNMNMWDDASELGRLNARAGKGPIPASRDLVAAAARGIELARLTGGVFDPSVGPLVRLWGIGGPDPRVPTQAQLLAARALVDWRRVTVDEAAGTIALAPGMRLDFGALAKGYGAEEGGRVLAAMGVRSGLLDVGGCVLVIGSGPKGAAWRIGVQDPESARGSPLGYFSVRDAAVDTSGVYERFFESAGHRYAHIMDTRTGLPVEGDVVSATVAVPRNQNSDGPPLAMLVLGMDGGLALADTLGIAAVLIGRDRRVHLSKAARGTFTLIDTSYSLSGK